MNRPLFLALLSITVVGGLLRAMPVVLDGFPLNDGGLFLAMVDGIRDQWPRLPETVGYNGEAIPMAYPPLGFYVTAGFMTVTGSSGTQAFQMIPVALSIASIPAAFVLFRRLLDTEMRAIVATAAFAAIPRAYEVAVSGGGVARAPGLLLALLTLAAALGWMRSQRMGDASMTGILLAVTGLSHPQAGVFAGTSIIVLAAFRAPRTRTAALQLLGITSVAAAVVAPWLFVVLFRHGPDTVLGAIATGGSFGESIRLIASLRFSDGLFEILGIIGIFGLVVAVVNRKWLFPVWMLATLLVSARAGPNYGSIMLAAGVAYAVSDLLRVLRGTEPRDLARLQVFSAATGILLIVATLGVADAAGSRLRPLSPLRAMDDEARQAIEWIGNETAPGSVVLVLSGTGWFVDAPSEWMPVLADRRSSATVQGSEWLGPGTFHEREARYVWLQSCAAAGRGDCVAEWERVVEPVDFVLALRSTVAESEGLRCCLDVARLLEEAGGDIVFANSRAIVVVPAEPPTQNAGPSGHTGGA